MKITDKYVLFWGGIYSQWYRADIIIDGMEFNCNEQYMMYKKAMLFGDDANATRIMETLSPKEQKGFGRKVTNFNVDAWNAVCKDIVFSANFAKFTQHADLYSAITDKKLINLEFVEASAEDDIWGIGLDENDTRAYDSSTWIGTNWLGEAITKVRDGLIINGN